MHGNPWLEWQFNGAVLLFGRWAEQRMNETNREGKRKYKTLSAALGEKKKMSVVNVQQFAGVQGILVK